MWQMTMNEFVSESFKPYSKDNGLRGITNWFCPVCGHYVGMYSTGQVHNEGWLFKRNRCPNGHNIEWE